MSYLYDNNNNSSNTTSSSSSSGGSSGSNSNSNSNSSSSSSSSNTNNMNTNNMNTNNMKYKTSNIIFSHENNNEILTNICSFLWYPDVVKTSITSKIFYNIIKNDIFYIKMFCRLLHHMGRHIHNDNDIYNSNNQCDNGHSNDNKLNITITNNNYYYNNWETLSKRVTLWPTSIDNVIIRNFLEPRNICICNSDNNTNGNTNGNTNDNTNANGNSNNLCVLYKRNANGDSHKTSFAVVVADQYFPCLPRAHSIAIIKSVLKTIDHNVIPSSNSSHNSISSHNSNSNSFNELYRPSNSSNASNALNGDSIYRSSAPFTKIFKTSNNNDVAILSCIAYFEVKIHEDNTISNINNGNSTHSSSSKNNFSIGLACPLFPLRRKYPGFDNYSFGYHCDGKFYHGGKNCTQKVGPSYSTGDIVGCGIIYPPLSRNYGRVFFTKNGEIASILDINNIGLLSVPWFPILGLQESVKMEFNFGLNKPFLFDTHAFEHQQITRLFEGATWSYYDTIVKEAESTDNIYRHPKWLDAYATMNSNNNVKNNHNSNYKRDDNDGDDTSLKCNNDSNASHPHANSNLEYSLFLDTNLRASILLYMNKAKKVAFGGSDASWEGTAEEEDDEEDYSDYYYNDDEVMTNHNTSTNAILEPIIVRRGDRHDDWHFGKRQRIEKLNSDASGDEYSSGIPIVTLQSEILESGKRDDNFDKEDETEMGCNNSMAVEWSSDDSGGERIALRDELPADSGPVVNEEPLSLNAAYIMALSDTSRAAGFLHRSGLGLGLGFDSDVDSERSIATSLFVEVASVDECGSYQGYGGASETEKEDEETGYHDDDNNSLYNSGSNNNTINTNRNNPLLREYNRNSLRYTWDRDGDGYDGASERGRCETDVGEADDLGTDADVGEEIGEEFSLDADDTQLAISIPTHARSRSDGSTGSHTQVRRRRHKRHRRSMNT